jgi:diguanylate cyclase (GGDEF)-like protein/PAS domain S-box-containing protein
MINKKEKIKSEEHVSINAIVGPLLYHKISHCWMPATIAQLTLDAMDDAVLSTDIDGKISYLNQAASKLTGWDSADAIGYELADVFQLKASFDDYHLPIFIRPGLQSNPNMQALKDCILQRKDGHETSIEGSVKPIIDELGVKKGCVMVFRDVSQAKEMTKKITYLAEHDTLTGLPNRLLFQERLSQALALAKRNDKLLAILYLDIDLFKEINDEHGHVVGDKLLCFIAKRMIKAVRDSDTVCRHGGDEFVVLLSEIEHPEDAEKFSHKLLSCLARPLLVEGIEICVSMSIGISIYPNHGDISDGLIDYADKAMFKAKANGRNCFLKL